MSDTPSTLAARRAQHPRLLRRRAQARRLALALCPAALVFCVPSGAQAAGAAAPGGSSPGSAPAVTSSSPASAPAVRSSSPSSAPTAASAPPARARDAAGAWDLPAQRAAVGAGLLAGPAGAAFGERPLTGAEAALALRGIARLQALAPLAVPAAPRLSVSSFDALLVEQLGLGEVAAHVERVAQQAGLEPPSYFGTEVLARYLGLRYEHPVGSQSLDLYPWEAITRAEAAWSLATVLAEGSWAVAGARAELSLFSLPHYDQAQLQVLRIAVSKIGMPYVWGGTTDGTEDGLEHGGYDCSGFVWRVFKVSGLPWGASIRGRTAAEQAGEIPRSQRIPLRSVQGGDLLFFGSARLNSPRATESNVIHEGIALSGEWAIHSSAQGVYVLPLRSGWLAESFAWARRVL